MSSRIRVLNYMTIDANAQWITPELEALIGTRITHTGNGKTYVIMAFVWNGATDEWMYLHAEVGKLGIISIVRPLSHLKGKRSNGEARYMP